MASVQHLLCRGVLAAVTTPYCLSQSQKSCTLVIFCWRLAVATFEASNDEVGTAAGQIHPNNTLVHLRTRACVHTGAHEFACTILRLCASLMCAQARMQGSVCKLLIDS